MIAHSLALIMVFEISIHVSYGVDITHQNQDVNGQIPYWDNYIRYDADSIDSWILFDVFIIQQVSETRHIITSQLT